MIPEYYPVITREMLSKFEYTRVVTAVAKYIGSHTSIKDLTEAEQFNNIIFNVDMAVEMLDSKLTDATLNRKTEIVTFSRCMMNPLWKETIKDYYISLSESIKKELFEAIGVEINCSEN
jgi:hypothetical protein